MVMCSFTAEAELAGMHHHIEKHPNDFQYKLILKNVMVQSVRLL